MRKMNKSIIILAASAMLVSSLTGCSGNAASKATTAAASQSAAEAVTEVETEAKENGEKPIIGVMIFDYANNYVTYVRNAITAVAGDDIEIQMVDAQNDQAKQVEQIDLMINKGAKVLCVNAVDPTAAQSIISKAKAVDIPLVFFNRCPSDADMMSYDKCWYVGNDPYESGVMQANMAMEAFKANPAYDKNGDGIMQYVIIQGTMGHPDAVARTQADQDTFKEAGFAAELLDTQTGDFKTATAKDVMDVWMGKYGDEIEMILSNNDAMLLGAIESCKSEGYFGAGDGVMGAIGINALPEVLDLIDNETIIGSIMSNAYAEGSAIYQMAHNALNGTAVLEGVEGELGEIKDLRVPYLPIGKDNVQEARDIYSNVLSK
ncbi:MAG: galactose ABC transporter substrate-binding protein [Lachnospiraceae bacterium]|nr:galactose ABC transporter substrate-binding protein [Lachnospiraceae bacterium]